MPTPTDIAVPPAARATLDVLEGAGFEAWLVGGFVRDALRGAPCDDIDIATSATWQQARDAFGRAGLRVSETGTAHGTITAIVEREGFEVTTFRSDGPYSDARHPDSVAFVRTIEEDLARRDFTVNAMAYHPIRGLCDPYGGRRDLAAGVIRAVGEAGRRFSEDALRILRAARFQSQLGFSIEAKTARAMGANKGLLDRVSAERKLHETEKLLLGDFVFTALMENTQVVAQVLPEIHPLVGFDQRSRYHIYDAWEHTAHVVAGTNRERCVRWAALCHDLGKPATCTETPDGHRHFKRHAEIGADITRGLMRRMHAGARLTTCTETLVRWHDWHLPPSERSARRLLARMGGDADMAFRLLDLMHADALAHAPEYQGRAAEADEMRAHVEHVLAAGQAFSLRQLAIRGDDLIAAGVPQGPAVGRALDACLDAVVEGDAPNEREALLRIALDAAGGS